MALPDNRIRLQPTPIDFDTQVGTPVETDANIGAFTHDDFPDSNQQPRWDWMRSFLIGLLSLQASSDEPIERRKGTPWLDLRTTTPTLKIYDGTEFINITKFMDSETGTEYVSLFDWIQSTNSIVENLVPKITFSGSASKKTTIIPIPTSIQQLISKNSKPLVHIDGILIDPRDAEFNSTSDGCVSQILLLNGVELVAGNRFTVIIDSFGVFHTSDVIA